MEARRETEIQIAWLFQTFMVSKLLGIPGMIHYIIQSPNPLNSCYELGFSEWLGNLANGSET